MSVAWNIEAHESLPSTQDFLKARAQESAVEGLVIQAHWQSAGHGRHAREWVSPPGNLYFSYLLKPDCEAAQLGQLSLLVSLALYHTLADVSDAPLLLKWPNDVLIGDARQKCAGILLDSERDVDGAVEWCVIGIGVNLMSAPKGAACVKTDASLANVLERYLAQFEALYDGWRSDGFEPYRQAWLSHAHEKGSMLSVKIGERLERGRFYDIDAHGNARIETEDGNLKVIASGDVFLNG